MKNLFYVIIVFIISSVIGLNSAIAGPIENVVFEKHEKGKVIRHIAYSLERHDVTNSSRNCFTEKRKNGLFFTKDKGKNWTKISETFLCQTFIVKNSKGDIFQTKNFGRTWEKISSGYNTTSSMEVNNKLPVVSSSQIQFSIFPNPAEKRIEVKISDLNYQILNISIYNQNGRELLRKKWLPTENFLDIHSIPIGIYFVVIRGNEGIIGVKKLIKK